MISLSPPGLVPPSVATARFISRRPSAISATTFTSYATSRSHQQYQHQHQHPPRPHRSLPCASPYEVLGIPAGATSEEIKTAYRRLARVLHPDAMAAIGAKDSSLASNDRFIRLHDAYSTLLDPEKRAVYDRRVLLARKRKRPVAVVAGAYSYGGRNWETDQCW